jgi:hypothetical protein
MQHLVVRTNILISSLQIIMTLPRSTYGELSQSYNLTQHIKSHLGNDLKADILLGTSHQGTKQ